MIYLKTFLCLILLGVLTFSCTPDEIPGDNIINQELVTAETDNQADEVIDRDVTFDEPD